MTPVLICGFECGALAAQWSANGTAPTVQTTIARNGGKAARVTTTSAQSYYVFTGNQFIGNVAVVRLYYYAVSLPGTTLASVFAAANGGSVDCQVGYNSSTGKFTIGPGSGTKQDGTTTAVAGQWYRFDIRVNGTADPWSIDWQIDGVDQGHYNATAIVQTFGGPALGPVAASTVDHVIDDVICSGTSGDYPIGDGTVVGYWPTSDGTHTSTSTNIVKGTTATPVGTAITSATTDAWQWVDGTTISDTADFWNQQTASSLQYVEVKFNTVGIFDIPRGVESLVALSAATNAANTQKAQLYDGTTATDIYASSTVGVQHPTLTYQRKCWAAAPSAAWTNALFNLLRVRWGFSGDATPDAYCDNIVLEAEFGGFGLVPYVNPTMPPLIAQ